MLVFLVKSSTCRMHWVTFALLPVERFLFRFSSSRRTSSIIPARLYLARSKRARAFSPIWLCNAIHRASNNSGLIQNCEILYLFCVAWNIILTRSYVSASTNLVGKFTQSVRRIVQDVKDEGTSSKSERYFITFILRGNLIKLQPLSWRIAATQ